MKKFSLIFLFSISICFIATGKPKLSQKTIPVTTTKPDTIVKIIQVATSKADTNVLSEGKAYKMLYENQKSANDSILKTIYYALGGLGTAALLVFASNWWFNEKKVNDLRTGISDQITKAVDDTTKVLVDKINNLSKEKTTEISTMQVKLQEEVTKNTTDLTVKFNEFTEKIRAEIKEDNRVLLNNYQELLKSYNDNLTQQIFTLKESYEEKIKLLTKQIEENDKKNVEQLKREAGLLKREVLRHNAAISFFEKSYNAALKSYLDFSLFEFEIGYDWSFKYNYVDIVKCLEKVTNIYEDESNLLSLLFELTKEKYPEQTEQIKILCKDKPIIKLSTLNIK